MKRGARRRARRGESSAAVEPRQRALNELALGQYDETSGLIGTLDDLRPQVRQDGLARGVELAALIGGIGEQPLQERIHPEQCRKQQDATVAILDALSRWNGLTYFLDDGRIEIDSNVVERSIRPIALNRKNALFAGSDGGAEHWAVVASLIETCKLNAIDPQAYLTDVLIKIVNGHPNSRIDVLLPWAYAAHHSLKDVA